jgi:hypothetical protein
MLCSSAGTRLLLASDDTSSSTGIDTSLPQNFRRRARNIQKSQPSDETLSPRLRPRCETVTLQGINGTKARLDQI